MMSRNLSSLANEHYDLLVIGGGIHGACIAWDATLRGLSVALVERGDFGQGTSANSLKTVHGGLRYLQDANLQIVRLMIHERRSLLRIAPHLVHPLPCLMPTYHRLMKSKPVMAMALLINDLIGFDRNHIPDPEKHLPAGKVLSREECLEILPGLPREGITGGAQWYDGQIYDSERLTLSFVLSAVKKGAQAANYVEATGLLREGDRIAGVKARDNLTGDEFAIRAKIVVNAAGPWVDDLLDRLELPKEKKKFHHSLAMNLVTRKFIKSHAVGVLSRPEAIPGNGSGSRKGRMLFISPWREFSLIGTFHAYYEGHPDEFRLNEAIIQDFIDETNSAYPGANLRIEDVRFVHKGFLPAENKKAAQDLTNVRLLRQGQVFDHQEEDGLDGLVTVVGVKYTSARHVSERAVDLVFKKLGKESPTCETDKTPLHDGQIERLGEYVSRQVQSTSGVISTDLTRHLVYNYGTNFPQVRSLVQGEAENGKTTIEFPEVLRGEVIYAIREEYAQKLADVVLRRTGLGSSGLPDYVDLQCCLHVMGDELGWDRDRREQEMDEVRSIYEPVNRLSLVVE
jgi:glycerol-3-phosphate dehydrogenase